MSKYSAGTIFVGPNGTLYILLDIDKTTKVWKIWCSGVNNTKNSGIIESWRSEPNIDSLLKDGIIINVEHYKPKGI